LFCPNLINCGAELFSGGSVASPRFSSRYLKGNGIKLVIITRGLAP